MKGSALCCCSRIGRSPAGVKATLITDTDGMSVVVLTVCSHLFFGSSLMDPAIPRDIVMISDIFEVPIAYVIFSAGFETETMTITGGRTVDDDECYLSHDKQLIQRLHAALDA